MSALGDGWAPAVINSPSELSFIKEKQKFLSNNRTYWIGGSTNIEIGEIITLFDYMTSESGTKRKPTITITAFACTALIVM